MDGCSAEFELNDSGFCQDFLDIWANNSYYIILHRRPDEEHDDLKTVVDEHSPPSRRKEIEAMVYSRAHRLLDEARAEGIEQGERTPLNPF